MGFPEKIGKWRIFPGGIRKKRGENKIMKRFLAITLLLSLVLALCACGSQGMLSNGKDALEDAMNDDPDQDHTVIRELQDGATTYYCWEDGIVTTKATYKADSALFWENDTLEGAYLVKNSMGIVFISYYVQPTQPTEETPVPTTEDPYKGHTLEGVVTDPAMAVTYYCWDDGTVTTEEAYSASSMTWTHPWNQNFFNIYNGHSDNGNVIYSEKACTWCGNHKVYYLSYIRDAYDFSKQTEFLCESCHVDLVSNYHMCYSCSCYYSNYWIIQTPEGGYYCEYCWNN